MKINARYLLENKSPKGLLKFFVSIDLYSSSFTKLFTEIIDLPKLSTIHIGWIKWLIKQKIQELPRNQAMQIAIEWVNKSPSCFTEILAQNKKSAIEHLEQYSSAEEGCDIQAFRDIGACYDPYQVYPGLPYGQVMEIYAVGYIYAAICQEDDKQFCDQIANSLISSCLVISGIENEIEEGSLLDNSTVGRFRISMKSCISEIEIR